MITLKIDGQNTEVEDGTKLLDAVERRGITLPTLCHHKALTPYGACRLCLVEVHTPGRAPAVQAACSYPALQGIEVLTGTDRVKRARKIVAELLLARCPDSDVIRRIAAEHGVHEPRIRRKNDDCVYCGLCVRMCNERMGRSAIGFTGRGPRKKLEPPFGKHNDACWTCGACDFICPVGKKIRSTTSARTPIPVANAYNFALDARPAVSVLYPQAVPNVPAIDPDACIHLQKNACGVCEAVCGAKAIDYHATEKTVDLDVGAIVLAPGFEPFDPTVKQDLGYGRFPNVLTAIQFERVLSPSGPYAGHVQRPSDGRPARRIAFIQCVGSRDAEHDYCSAVCCMYATKEAIVAKEHSKNELQCDIFFMDVRAYSKGFERYFESAKKLGVGYIRCRIPRVAEVEGTGNLTITYLGEDDRKRSGEYDLVVLSVGMTPPKNAPRLAQTFGFDLNPHGFCETSLFDSVDSSRDGIFVAGPFTEPKDIPETVLQGSAAAAKVLALLKDVKGQLIAPTEYPPETDVAGKEPRVGVFVCHCGTNIAGVVNVSEVAEYAGTLPNVVCTEHNLYTCSNDTQERIKEKIRAHGLNRVVVASCTPRTHEPLFRNTLREAGLNPFLFEMANIRDQCSWVHRDHPEEATVKAKDLVRIALAKARLDEPLYTRPLDVQQGALVIGGGLAGLTASLALAEQDFRVELVEREQQLGGWLRRTEYLLTGEDPQARLRELVSRAEGHENIHIHLGATISGVKGSLGNFTTTIAHGNGAATEIHHGVVIVATGATSYKPTEYMYGKDYRVLISEEIEDQINADVFAAKSVAFIQCVGSRNAERPYCSRMCCAETLKHALRLKEHWPETNVYVLYREMRSYGFREEYYTRARKEGVLFLRFADDRPPEVVRHNGQLRVSVHEQTIHQPVELLVDTVVLAPATVPHADNKVLAQMLKVPLTEDGFFLEAHRKLRPIDFATDGVFLCGNAHSPLGIAETVAQALGAAARASTILSRTQIDLDPSISHVRENCDGCAYCVDPCPFHAITLVEYQDNGQVKKRVQVDEAVCKGCGTCQATCPKNAIAVWHFRPEQIVAEIHAALGIGG